MIPTKREMLSKLYEESNTSETYSLETVVSKYIAECYKGELFSFEIVCSARKTAQALLELIKLAGYDVYHSKVGSDDIFTEDSKLYKFYVS